MRNLAKSHILILILGCLSMNLSAQEFAEFSTDTTRFRSYYSSGEGKLPPHITEQVWFINGQEMSYGADVIKIKPNAGRLDTIIYFGYRRNKPDTIICNIAEAKKYKFFHNDCCGAFDIQDESTRKFVRAKIVYQIPNAKEQTYLGTLGEAGIIVSDDSDTLTTNCRSAMSPNIYLISLKSIIPCTDELNCNEGICLQTKDDLNLEYGFETKSTLFECLFMPLSNEPVTISYDLKKNKIDIQ